MFIAKRMQQAKKGPQLVRLKLLCFGYPGTQPAFSIVYFLSESSPVVRKQGAARREVGAQDEMGREKGREGIHDSSFLFSSTLPFKTSHSSPRTVWRRLGMSQICTIWPVYAELQFYGLNTVIYMNNNLHEKQKFFADITHSEKWTVSANYA